MICRLLNKLASSSILMTWASLIARMGMAIIVLPYIVVRFNAEEISVWLFILIINRLRDIFDFGYLDNISREVSYSKGQRLTSGLKLVIDFSNFIYARNSTLCFIFLLLSITAGFYFKGHFEYFDCFDSVFIILVVVVSNSIYVYGNKYIAILFGLDYISMIRSWDTLFTLMNIGTILLGIIVFPSLITIITINSAWVVIAVLRNRYMASKVIFYECPNKEPLNEVNAFNADKIKKNANRDFFSSLLTSGYAQGFNYFISIFLPLSFSNTYLLLDNIVEQIKNLSRVPFYVNRPKMAAQYKKTGFLDIILIRKYIMFSTLTLCLSLFLFSIFAPYVLDLIDSKVEFDSTIWLVICTYAMIERLGAMHNQIYVIMNNKVIAHKYLPITVLISTVILSFFLFFNISPSFYVLAFSLSYLFTFYLPISQLNIREFSVKRLYFEAYNYILCIVSVLLLIFGVFYVN